MLVNGVLIIGVLNKTALDGRRRTQAVFRTRIEIVRRRLKETGAKLTITADGIRMHTLHRRLLQDTMRRTIAASHTFLRIDLPNCSLGSAPPRYYPQQSTHSSHRRYPRSVAQKVAPTPRRFFVRITVHAFIIVAAGR